MRSTISLRSLGISLAALLGLTAISWALTRGELGAAGTPVALAIAATKAVIVAVAFMELLGASLPARVIALVTIGFIALLCAGTVTDIVLR